ncbi:hypothetical protein R6Q59_036149 [Mikania micrantha]
MLVLICFVYRFSDVSILIISISVTGAHSFWNQEYAAFYNYFVYDIVICTNALRESCFFIGSEMNECVCDTTPPLQVYKRKRLKKVNRGSSKLTSLEQLELLYGFGFDPFNPLREAGKFNMG